MARKAASVLRFKPARGNADEGGQTEKKTTDTTDLIDGSLSYPLARAAAQRAAAVLS